MSESYTVQASLRMTSNVPEVLGQATAGFERLARMLRETQELLSKFGSSTAGFNRFANNMKKLGETRIGGGLIGDLESMSRVTGEIAASQAKVAEAARATAAAYRDAAEAGRRMTPPAGGGPGAGAGAGGKSAGKRGLTHTDYVDAGMGLQIAGSAGDGLFERAFMAEAEVQHLITQFRQKSGISDTDLSSIRAKAEQLVRDVPGTTIAQNIHAILDAYTITSDLGESLASAKALAITNQALASVPGNHEDDPAFKAMQSVEVMQRFYDPVTHKVDMAAMEKQIGLMTQVAVASGGRASPAQYLAFAKQARVGGMVANDQFLYSDLPAMLIALNGSRSGTGEAATWRQFIQGRMTKSAAEKLKEFGFIDQGAKWKGGRVDDMMHHLAGAEEFAANPVQWMRDVGFKLLKARGIDPNDKLAMGNALGSFASTATGLGFLSEIGLGMAGINKEATNIGNTTNDPMKALQNDPMQKLKEFHAAENEFLVALGSAIMGPAIDALKGLTSALRDYSDWARANPGAGKEIAEVAAVASLFASSMGHIIFGLMFGIPVLQLFGTTLKTVADGVWGFLVAKKAADVAEAAAGKAVGPALGGAPGGAVGGAAGAEGGALAGVLAGTILGGIAAGALYVGSKYETPQTAAAKAELDRQRRGLDGGPNGGVFDGFDAAGNPVSNGTARARGGPQMNLGRIPVDLGTSSNPMHIVPSGETHPPPGDKANPAIVIVQNLADIVGASIRGAMSQLESAASAPKTGPTNPNVRLGPLMPGVPSVYLSP